MNFIIVVREPSEETIDFLVSNFPVLANGDSAVIPYDCLDDMNETNIEFEIIKY